MSDRHKVAAAEIEVERTRAALMETVNELLERFQPHNLVEDLWEQTKMKGADLAEDAVDAVKKRPVAVGGAVAALTMFLAREPLKDATVKFYDVMTSLLEPRTKRSKKKEAPAKLAKPVAPKAKEIAPKPAKPPARRQTRSAPRAAPKKTEKA